MKSTSILLLFGLSLVFSQTNTCFRSCVRTNPASCPQNAACADFGNDRFGCVCYPDTLVRCEGEVFECVPRETNGTTGGNGCGEEFPNGCPELSYCLEATHDGITRSICVCRDGYIMRERTCEFICPPYSHPIETTNAMGCQCDDGYERDTFVEVFRCRPVIVNPTCSNDRCPTGYTCRITNTNQIECVPNHVDPRCGFDFRCPDNQICQTTENGPRCFCPPGRVGPNCEFTPCWNPTDDQGNPIGPLGCWWLNSQADCRPNPDNTRPPYCICRDGYTGPECAEVDTLCTNVRCEVENTHCERGRCVCDAGYLPARNEDGTEGFHCRRIQRPENCENYEVDCHGNRICVSLTDQDNVTNPSDLRCGCPESFGGRDCNKPRCESDADCQFTVASQAFCLRSTREGVPSFCACRDGYTGPRCDQPVTCDVSICPDGTRYDCNNEGGCGCRPGREGDGCDVDNSTNICIVLHIYLRRGTEYTAEQVRNRLAEFLRVDRLNIDVQGPNRRNDGRIEFTIRICGNRDVDEESIRQNLEDTVTNGGDDGGLEIEAIGNIPDSSIDDGDENSAASTLVVSTIVVVAAIANL